LATDDIKSSSHNLKDEGSPVCSTNIVEISTAKHYFLRRTFVCFE